MQELANQPRHNGWRRSTALKTQFMSFIGFDMCAQGHGFSVQQLSDPEETSVSARLQLGLGFRGLLETPPWTGRALTWPLAARVPHILASWTRLALAARFWKAEGQYEESGPATSWRFLALPGASWGFLGLPGASWQDLRHAGHFFPGREEVVVVPTPARPRTRFSLRFGLRAAMQLFDLQVIHGRQWRFDAVQAAVLGRWATWSATSARRDRPRASSWSRPRSWPTAWTSPS